MARLLRFGFLLLLLSSFAVVSAMRPLDSGQDPAHGSLRALGFSSSSDDKNSHDGRRCKAGIARRRSGSQRWRICRRGRRRR